MTYGYSVKWTDRDGSRTRLTVDGMASMEEAKQEAIDWAIANGWTPRRWWQWWRWNDTIPLGDA